jgi:hypothetical protein
VSVRFALADTRALTFGLFLADTGCLTFGFALADTGALTFGFFLADTGCLTFGFALADTGCLTFGFALAIPFPGTDADALLFNFASANPGAAPFVLATIADSDRAGRVPGIDADAAWADLGGASFTDAVGRALVIADPRTVDGSLDAATLSV